MKYFFESTYPNISHFVKAEGYIEMGYDDDSPLTSEIRRSIWAAWSGR